MSIDAVMSRVSEIQNLIDGLSGRTSTTDRILGTVSTGGSTTTGTGSTTASTTSGADAFSAALRSATGDTATAATTIPSTTSSTTTPTTTTVSPVVATSTPVTTRATTPTSTVTPTVTTTPTTAPTTRVTTPTASLGSRAVSVARQYLGVPYRWGGTDPSTGLDCSGLVQLVYGKLGVKLPRVAIDQARVGTAVPSLGQAAPGDLIVFNGGDHIGIYLGGGKMIDAPHTGARVRVSNVAGYGSIYAIRRLGSATGSASATAPTSTTPTAATGLNAYQGLFTAAEAKYHLPTGLLRAIAQVESGGNASAVSRAGAQGLMQIMPSTARGLGVNPFSPAQAVDGAARLMAANLSSFGNLDLAVAAYNAGAGAVRRYHGIPPYAETRAYVTKVRAAMNASVA